MIANINKRLTEISEILSYLPEEDFLKIPLEIRNMIEKNKDKEYFWEYDETKTLEEQGLHRDTIVYLSYLNTQYILNDEEKQVMKQIYKLNEKNINGKNATKSKENFQKNLVENKVETKVEGMTEYKENVFVKIWNSIKRFFKK